MHAILSDEGLAKVACRMVLISLKAERMETSATFLLYADRRLFARDEVAKVGKGSS
jgi:hypothetical protein